MIVVAGRFQGEHEHCGRLDPRMSVCGPRPTNERRVVLSHFSALLRFAAFGKRPLHGATYRGTKFVRSEGMP
jgi:hypothetical protein